LSAHRSRAVAFPLTTARKTCPALPPERSNTPLKADPDAQRRNLLVCECVAPITYKGQSAIRNDIDNFKSALKDVNVADAFMPVAAPTSARGLWLNTYFEG
jgi:hypothetical protein